MTDLSPVSRADSRSLFAPWGMEPGRLRSLCDMLKESAEAFIELGQRVHDAGLIYFIEAYFDHYDTQDRTLNEDGVTAIRAALRPLLKVAERLELATSMKLIGRRLGYADTHPKTREAFDMLVEVIKDELSTKLFLFVPPNRSKYHQYVLPNAVLAAFPSASAEIVEGASAYAYGLNSACVFHSMRAAEIGVRCLGEDLGVKFPFDIALAEWHNILDQVDKKIKEKKDMPKGEAKERELQFLSEAASQFRYFKDGWRIRVAHARAVYNEQQARDVLEHVMSFFETLSSQMSEHGL